MTITRKQVADLRPGDVVELTFLHEYDATTITARGTFPAVVDWFENHEGGKYTLTVVSRAPRLYVNHDRAEPVPGDVVRGEDVSDCDTWAFREGGHWCHTGSGASVVPGGFDGYRLRLLVDGETGQVVP